MYYVWEDNAHIPLERSKLAQAIMQTYLPGWTADLTESARPHWLLNRHFTWRLNYPDSSTQASVVQIEEEVVSVAQVTSALQHESERITIRLLERLHGAAASLAGVLPGRGWQKADGIWLSPGTVQELARRRGDAILGEIGSTIKIVRVSSPRRWAALPLTTSERLPDPPATREDIFVQHLISLTQEHMA